MAQVKVLEGALEGCEGVDYYGNKFVKFLGIPYAKPPVGELRFKDPQPPNSWIGVRAAKTDGQPCYHKNLQQQVEGGEDCLYLNVYTKELPTDDEYNLRPVMVFIHGGGFRGGSNSSLHYGAEFLMSDDIVLVSINYRFGLLGFLHFKDPTLNVHGNMGFKDQLEALRWIKNNIQQFNGDPDNVTLFGESAGAASVHYHVLSPLSRDLFHKAILQSGAALNPWADEIEFSPVQIAKLIDPSVWTEKDAYEIFKNLPVDKLYDVFMAFQEKIEYEQIQPRALTIEPSSRKNAFLTKRPIDIITSGDYNKVPMMFGYNNREGLLFNQIKKRRGDNRKIVPDYFLPHNVNFHSNKELRQEYINKMHNLYLTGPNTEDNENLLISDSWFIAGIIASVKNHAQTSPFPVYLYKLSLETQLNFAKALLGVQHLYGCTHGDDLGYLFKTTLTPTISLGSNEDISLVRMVRLWTNFARYGNPTPNDKEFDVTWKPARARQLNTLHITEELTMEINPEGKRMDLWRQLYHESNATNKFL